MGNAPKQIFDFFGIIRVANPLGVIRFRRDELKSDRASRILVGLVKKREKTVIANNDYALAA